MSALLSWVGIRSSRWRRIDQFRRLEIELLTYCAIGIAGWMWLRP